MSNIKAPHIVLVLVIFAGGIAVGHFFFFGKTLQNSSAAQQSPSAIRETNNSYSLISPLLMCDSSANTPSIQYKDLGQALQKIVDAAEVAGRITNASIYFRDLLGGRWAGINENDQYSPASLFKIPIMIAYFKEAEQDPSVLTEQLQYAHAFSEDVPQMIPPSATITLGKFYTEQDLISRMIVSSDNISEQLLLSHLNANYIQEVFTDLGLDPNVFQENTDTMSVKSFSLFFRILYNSTYLSRAMSEKALELLAQSDFSNGIVAGVPNGVKIAHKFGERTYVSPTMGEILVREFHECGIVYALGQPYLLCVMTRGNNYATMEDTIQSISRVVYDDVIKQQ